MTLFKLVKLHAGRPHKLKLLLFVSLSNLLPLRILAIEPEDRISILLDVGLAYLREPLFSDVWAWH